MTHALTRRTLLVGVVPVVAAGLLVLAGPARPAAAGVAPGSTERLSVADGGGQVTTGDVVSNPAVSADGRYVAFSDSGPVDPAAGSGVDGVYVRDRAAPGHTVLLSRGAGGSANGASDDPSISADGRYVAFDTSAANIPDGDEIVGAEALDVVVADRDPEGDGRFDKTLANGAPDYRYVVVGRLDEQAGGRLWSNERPSISADGTTIAWQQNPVQEGFSTVVVATLGKDATGKLLPPAEADYHDVDVPNPTGNAVDATYPRLSADGGHVAFTAFYCVDCGVTTEVRPHDVPGTGAVLLVEDLARRRTVELDIDAQGHQLTGTPGFPSLSGDGSRVAFSETGADGTDSRVIVVDRDPGTGTAIGETVAATDNSGAPANATTPALSTDGHYLAYLTGAPNAEDGTDPPDTEVLPAQVVERDLDVDAARAAAKLPPLPGELATPSVRADCAVPAGAACPGDGVSGPPVLDGDGGVVAYLSNADDLVPGDTNGIADVFARQFQPSLRADPLAFGTVPVGSSAVATLTVHQVGFGPVHLGSVTVVGGDFGVFPSQTCQDATLYETGACLVSIRFTPQVPGPRGGTLHLVEAGRPAPFTVGLSGGAGPAVDTFRATPDPLVFPGPALAFATSAPQVVTVTNTGSAPFTVSAVSPPAGPGLFAGDYTITRDTCVGAPLPGGGTCQVTVVDVPHGAGGRPGALAFTDSSAGSPQLVGLSAAGMPPTLRANPAVVADGRVTTLVGQGFPAGHAVAVTLPNLPGAATVSAIAGPHGDFTVALPVFEHTETGTWQATATATGTGLTATAPLLVVQGTYQPPDFTTRD